ncbi:general transcriptional corepressor ssn6 [Fusarium tjaetaba]|uniref:General transcriptional corepressor ssn6 n=1 Tax=Fusarium tjaetaba TaxID=1567544 RepID=A0A8H5QKR6_9HYPO|nr:general transcriptional corepressor ssn6 [Fusarium tjaetaba]KAF5617049.1 general transcriptional corepressor ssn6 [Fusarium tjaetaba]
MSFGYGVGDVIAVLGLFERIAIELRNYKDAPMHFQQLRAELDLMRGTLKRVLSLEPESDAERETLEQIRAIVIYCARPLQSMSDKMRSKESSLGHFKTTRSPRSGGTRLHWSMIGLDDVQELRKTVMSQMAAINVLLSVQQHLARCSSEMLEAISKITRMLLDIRVQLKHIISAIEAIPLHLTLDIVRLDDVHGESWALPLQAYRTWESFRDILQFVVYPSERPGAKYITNNLFTVAQAKTSKEVNQETWETLIKPGFHLEQAVVLKMNYWLERCLDPNCNGTLVDQVLEFGSGQVCNVYSRSAKTEFVKTRVVDLYNEAPYSHDPVERFANLTGTKRNFGTELPPIDMDEKIETFRRVKFLHPMHPLSNEKGGYDPKLNPAVAHAFSGLATPSPVEGIHYENPVEDARDHLETSVKLDSSIPENWYLLSRACMVAKDYERAYQCLQTAISLENCCPSFWITLGILYFNIGQSRDCLDALTNAVELNTHIWEPWYNLGVLYDS